MSKNGKFPNEDANKRQLPVTGFDLLDDLLLLDAVNDGRDDNLDEVLGGGSDFR